MNRKELPIDLLRTAKFRFLLLATLSLLWVTPQSAAGQAQPGSNMSQQEQSGALSAEQVLANPGILHQRLRAKNPGYLGQAQFAQDPETGLVGDFTGTVSVEDL